MTRWHALAPCDESFFATAPHVYRFAEDYLVEPSGTGTRFTWTFAAEGTPRTRLLLRVLSPVNRLAFRRMAHGAKGCSAKHR